jgi:hypothetical protein
MGRPSFKPTQEQRHLVKSMAAVGTQHEMIALKIGVSAKTLRKRFRHELDTGSTDANYKVASTLFQMATSGTCPAATIFWTKTRNKFRERQDDRQFASPDFVVNLSTKGPTDDHA